jgi:hypothetical protein
VDESTRYWLLWVGFAILILLTFGIYMKINRVEGLLLRLMRHHDIDPAERLPLSDRVKEIARDPARKIEAIKFYREETGAGLAEAKRAVEDYIRTLDR